MDYEFLKPLFAGDQEGGEPKRLSFEEFTAALNENRLKIANLSGGGYIQKEKYDRAVSEAKRLSRLVKASERPVQPVLQGVPTEEVEALKNAHKAELEALRAEVNEANKGLKIRDYLEKEKFTSRFARTYLVKEMTKNPEISLIDGELVGVEAAMKTYKEIYADAFASEQPPEPEPEPEPARNIPYFTVEPANESRNIPRNILPHFTVL